MNKVNAYFAENQAHAILNPTLRVELETVDLNNPAPMGRITVYTGNPRQWEKVGSLLYKNPSDAADEFYSSKTHADWLEYGRLYRA